MVRALLREGFIFYREMSVFFLSYFLNSCPISLLSGCVYAILGLVVCGGNASLCCPSVRKTSLSRFFIADKANLPLIILTELAKKEKKKDIGFLSPPSFAILVFSVRLSFYGNFSAYFGCSFYHHTHEMAYTGETRREPGASEIFKRKEGRDDPDIRHLGVGTPAIRRR